MALTTRVQKHLVPLRYHVAPSLSQLLTAKACEGGAPIFHHIEVPTLHHAKFLIRRDPEELQQVSNKEPYFLDAAIRFSYRVHGEETTTLNLPPNQHHRVKNAIKVNDFVCFAGALSVLAASVGVVWVF